MKVISFEYLSPPVCLFDTITAREGESHLGISYNSAKQKLDDMVTAGMLASEKIGKSTEYFLAR